MNSRISATVFGAALLFSGASMAQQASTGLYVGGAIGQSTFWDTELDGGGDLEYDFLAPFFSGAVGFRVSPNLRVEAELLYESADIDNSSSDIEVIRGTVSGYYDLSSISMGSSGITPYVGGGFGFANIEIGDDENELTWHAETGVSVPIANNLEFVPGIRFEYIFLDENGIDDDSLWITQLRAGVRYSF